MSDDVQVISSLPSPRNSLHDRHHLFWPSADMRRYGLEEFRGIACTSAFKFDSMVHSIVHQRFAGVLGLSDPSNLADFRYRSNALLQRHYNRSCACHDPRNLRVIDALTLEDFSARTFDRPPCTGLMTDVRVLELMREYYGVKSPVTDHVRYQLELRCDNGECGCTFQQGNVRLRRAPAWVA